MAARQATGALPAEADDAPIVQRVRAWLDAQAPRSTRAAALVETAGGVHSPAPSGASQADLYRPLRLPVVLIGSSALGGISTTRSAYESLRMRGYDVDAVLLFYQERYQNHTYLAPYFAELGVPVFTLGGPAQGVWGAPPPPHTDAARERDAMLSYYLGLVHGPPDAHLASAVDVVRHLRTCHDARLARLAELGTRAHQHVWWPFTQHTRVPASDVLAIDSAHGDFFAAHTTDDSGSRLVPVLDGSASWWTQAVGHAHPRLALAAAYAAGRYGHVLFPGAANEPAVTLAERLLGVAPSSLSPGRGWAHRVFFSDDGSTAMEVGLKMALQASVRRYDAPSAMSRETEARTARGRELGGLSGRPARPWEVLGLRGSYHGDTIGAMDACEPSVYSEQVAWYQGRGAWLTPPTLRLHDGTVLVEMDDDDRPGALPRGTLAQFSRLEDVYAVEARLDTPLAQQYRAALHRQLEHLVVEERRRFGALVLEPLVMGAGGMIFVDPLYQRCLVDVVRAREDLFALTDAPLRDARAPQPERPAGAWRGLPVVFDEVFTGLRRLGFGMAADVLGVHPDISCLAKILSGGLVPLSVTLASRTIFETFAGSTDKSQALLHGHSYTAHPVGCHVALETLDMLEELDRRGAWADAQAQWSPAVWSVWDRSFVDAASRWARVRGVMALGTVLKLELKTEGPGGYASTTADELLHALRHPASRDGQAGNDDGVTLRMHLRPLGPVVYVMTSLTTPRAVRTRIQAVLEEQLS